MDLVKSLGLHDKPLNAEDEKDRIQHYINIKFYSSCQPSCVPDCDD